MFITAFLYYNNISLIYCYNKLRCDMSYLHVNIKIHHKFIYKLITSIIKSSHKIITNSFHYLNIKTNDTTSTPTKSNSRNVMVPYSPTIPP